MVLELQRAERVRDALDGVRQRVREVVHRVDAPRVAGAVMLGVADAVEHRVAHVDVRRRHVDLRAQHVRAVGELAGAHAAEQVEVLVDARGRGTASCVPGSVSVPRYSRISSARQRIDVGDALLDQLLGELVELLEVVGRVELAVAPVEPEPAHVVHDRVDVLDVFLDRVGVVEAQVAVAAELAGDAEVEADGLGVADVQVAVRLRREARDDAAAVRARGDVSGDDLANEVERLVGAASRVDRPCGSVMRRSDQSYCAQGGPDSVARTISGLRPRRDRP